MRKIFTAILLVMCWFGAQAGDPAVRVHMRDGSHTQFLLATSPRISVTDNTFKVEVDGGGIEVPRSQVLSYSYVAEAGITTPGTTDLVVRVQGRDITVSGLPESQTATLFDLGGTAVASCQAPQATLTAPAPGVYILRSGSQTLKLTVK